MSEVGGGINPEALLPKTPPEKPPKVGPNVDAKKGADPDEIVDPTKATPLRPELQPNTKVPETAGPSDKPTPQDLILRHLRGEKTLQGSPEEFPDTLDLGALEPEIRGLRDQHADTFIYTEEERKRMLTEGKDPEWVNRKEGEVEITRTIYTDKETGEIKYFDVSDYHDASVGASRGDGRRLGQTVLLELHTHVGESLPSIRDFAPLIMGVPELQRRVLNAIMILGPKTQILALATDAAQILTPQQTASLVAEWMQKSDEAAQESAAPHAKSMGTIEQVLVRSVQRQLAGHMEASSTHVDRLIAAADRGEDLEGVRGQQEDAVREFERKRDETIQRGMKLHEGPAARHEEAINTSFKETQREFAKQMGIKLYRSTDFRHFEAMAA